MFEFSENFTQLKCGASSLQVFDKFLQNFADGFLKSKKSKVGGYQNILLTGHKKKGAFSMNKKTKALGRGIIYQKIKKE